MRTAIIILGIISCSVAFGQWEDTEEDTLLTPWASDIDSGGYDLYNQSPKTTDAAPDASSIAMGQDAYSLAVTNTTGGSSILTGGLGTTKTKFVGSAILCPAGTTVTLSGVSSNDGTAWTETYTEDAVAPLGWDWGTTNATAATNLAATITAAPIASLYVTASAGGVASEFVGIRPIAGRTSSLTIATSAAACNTITNGADGQILIPDGSASAPSIAMASDTNSGMYKYDTDKIGIAAGGTAIFYVTGNGIGINGLVNPSSYVLAGSYLSSTTYTQVGTDLYVGSDILTYPIWATADAAPSPTLITSLQPTYARGATYDDGSNIILAPAQGMINITGGNRAISAGDTVTITATCQGIAQAPVVKTADTSWVCSTAASDAACIDNLYTLMNTTSPTNGANVAHTTGQTTMTVQNNPGGTGECEYVTIALADGAADGVWATKTQGTNGQVLFPSGSAAVPSISFIGDPDTGIYGAGNELKFTAGAGLAVVVSSSSIQSKTALVADSYVSAATYITSGTLNLTAAAGGATGNATLTNNGYLRTAQSKMAFTHAAFATACDTVDTCDFKMVTLPARTIVKSALFVVDLAETHLSDLTVSCGRTGASYIDYVVASNAKAQAVYGDATAEIGAGLAPIDIPSTSGTTDVYCQFVTTDGAHDLGDSEAFVGWLVLETALLP